VVILGGVTALLPIFARDILLAGPIGLGLLRSAPAAGALITSIVLSHYPVERRIGVKMFAVVAIYALATINSAYRLRCHCRSSCWRSSALPMR
jgi:hypothetical protein